MITIPEPTYDEDGDYVITTEREALAACYTALRYVVNVARVYASDPKAAALQMEETARFAIRALSDCTYHA